MIEENKLKVKIKKNGENFFHSFVEQNDKNYSQQIVNNLLQSKIVDKVEYTNQHKQYYEKIKLKEYLLTKNVEQKGKNFIIIFKLYCIIIIIY